MGGFAELPAGGCWAVIFSSKRREEVGGDDGYAETAARMEALARGRAGFLGIESARGADGFGITVSYWRSEADIAAWKADVEHAEAQRLGRERWYERYAVRVARVERGYGRGHSDCITAGD